MEEDPTIQFDLDLIARANQGDHEAGVEVLRSLISKIDHGLFDSPLFEHLADCLQGYVDGIPLDRALCVEPPTKKRGTVYDPIELAAVDILLRRELGKSAEGAVDWILQNIGADRRTTQRIRAEHKPMESLDTDMLLHLAGSRRKKVSDVLPHI